MCPAPFAGGGRQADAVGRQGGVRPARPGAGPAGEPGAQHRSLRGLPAGRHHAGAGRTLCLLPTSLCAHGEGSAREPSALWPRTLTQRTDRLNTAALGAWTTSCTQVAVHGCIYEISMGLFQLGERQHTFKPDGLQGRRPGSALAMQELCTLLAPRTNPPELCM